MNDCFSIRKGGYLRLSYCISFFFIVKTNLKNSLLRQSCNKQDFLNVSVYNIFTIIIENWTLKFCRIQNNLHIMTCQSNENKKRFCTSVLIKPGKYIFWRNAKVLWYIELQDIINFILIIMNQIFSTTNESGMFKKYIPCSMKLPKDD